MRPGLGVVGSNDEEVRTTVATRTGGRTDRSNHQTYDCFLGMFAAITKITGAKVYHGNEKAVTEAEVFC